MMAMVSLGKARLKEMRWVERAVENEAGTSIGM